MAGNKDYLVTMKVTFTKKYIVNARDWEVAEDYAEDELFGDTFSLYDSDDVEYEAYEVEEV